VVETILFFIIAAFALVSAIGMVLQKNPVYSVLLLIVTLFAIAGLYVLLNASFIAAVHMIVYAGAIMVLFLFVVMMLDLREDIERINLKSLPKFITVSAVGILFVEMAMVISLSFGAMSPLNNQVADTPAVGNLLFTKYLLPFEVASVLLLAAIIGTVIIARKKLVPTHSE